MLTRLQGEREGVTGEGTQTSREKSRGVVGSAEMPAKEKNGPPDQRQE